MDDTTEKRWQDQVFTRKTAPWWFAAFGVLFAAIAIAATAGGSSSPTSTTVFVNPVLTTELDTYLREGFTGTSWYPSIVKVTVTDTGTVVGTNLPASDRKTAGDICAGVSGWVFSKGSVAAGAVTVNAADGTAIIERKNLADRCTT